MSTEQGTPSTHSSIHISNLFLIIHSLISSMDSLFPVFCFTSQ